LVRSILIPVVTFALGTIVGLLSGPSFVASYREENRLLREMNSLLQRQLDEINAVLNGSILAPKDVPAGDVREEIVVPAPTKGDA